MSRARGRRHGVVEILLITVVVLYAAALLVGPLVAIVWGAVSHGAAAIARELGSASALHSLWLTLLLSAVATVVNTAFGGCIAWVMVREEFRGKRFLNGLIDLPFAVSPVIAGFMLILLFGRGGWLTPVADALGVKVVFALPGMMLSTIFVSIPFVIREVMPVLEHLGVEQELAAYTMGASRWRTFFHVTLPGIRWGVLYGVSLTFARALGEFGAILVVGGGVARLTETSTLYIYRSLDDRNEVGAFAMALVLAAVSFTVLVVMEFFKKRAHAEE